MLDSIDCIS